MSTLPKYLLFLVIITTSCKQGWSDKEKNAYIERCMAREMVNERTVKADSTICDCLLKKTMAKCPEPRDTVKITYQDNIEWGAKCLGFE